MDVFGVAHPARQEVFSPPVGGHVPESTVRWHRQIRLGPKEGPLAATHAIRIPGVGSEPLDERARRGTITQNVSPHLNTLQRGAADPTPRACPHAEFPK